MHVHREHTKQVVVSQLSVPIATLILASHVAFSIIAPRRDAMGS